MSQHPDSRIQTSQWTSILAYLIAGFILFETITGLFITFLPFNLANQVMVLIHTGIGLIFLIPFAWYQVKHWMEYKSRPMSDVVITGYISMSAVVIAIVSGCVLTYQAILTSAISYLWRDIHLISTFVMLAAILPHILLIVYRDYKARHKKPMEERIKAEKSFGFNSFYIVFIQFAVVGLFMFAYSNPDLLSDFPDDYEFPHGHENPFSPSLAQTSTGNVIDPMLLGGSQSCGSAGCHEEITKEWESSAHRYAAADPFFRAVQSAMAEEKGAASTRYCAGCHDPISLFAGTKDLHSDQLTNQMGFTEGVSCLSCHAISSVDERGNADFLIEPPIRYMFELHDSPLSKWLSDFLIRAYPQQHIDSYSRSFYRTSEYCSSCHKQFIDEEINNVGWVQLQNQYDPWRESHWHVESDITSTIECRECHMPLTPSDDPASGDALDYNRSSDDGKHRSHRFLGANQFVPTVLDLPGADEHVRMIEEWLQGKIEIPEIADKWVAGPAMPISIAAPDVIHRGNEVQVDLILTNNKAGHDFPTGPLDIIQSWVEIEAEDQNGNLIFSSGTLDEDYFIEPGAFMFRAEPVDQYGNPIDRHNLWDMVGVRYSRALFPGKSDHTRYIFPVESSEDSAAGPSPDIQQTEYRIPTSDEEITDIYITAKLQYRKVNQYLMQEVFREMLDIPTAPVTTISEDQKHIRVIP